MTFTEKLRILRNSSDLTEKQLAEKLKVSLEEVFHWEQNKSKPEFHILIQLSKIYDVSLEDLLNDEIDINLDVEIVKENNNLGFSTREVMYCTECGEEHSIDSLFCGYCGKPFEIFPLSKDFDSQYTQEEINLMYYKTDIQLQRKNLQLKEIEINLAKEQRDAQFKQIELQEKQIKTAAKCPRCKSTSLTAVKKGYGLGKGLLGVGLLGPIGLMAGGLGSNKIRVVCMKCGHRFNR